MRVVIMQPTYLPWLGYFDLMEQSDIFVFRDEVQFEKQSWQQRNRIKTPNGVVWLTVPVHKPLIQSIFKIEIDEVGSSKWSRSHWNVLRNAYYSAPYWKTFESQLEEMYTSKWQRLADLNIALIEWLAKKLEIATKTLRASSLDLPAKGQHESLVSLIGRVGGNVYLSPLGSAMYLRDENLFASNNISIEFQNYAHPEYHQLYPPFVPYLSALDLLLNEGENALGILRSGRRTPYSLAEAVALVTNKQENRGKDETGSL